MLSSSTPSKLPLPFAGGGSALKNTIPEASQISITAGAASLTDGFPPLTMTPIAGGGVPPFGQDMNGILYAISSIARWMNAGGSYAFDSTFANDANVNGYPNGAVIKRSDNTGFWLSTADNNTFNPDISSSFTATISTTNMTVTAMLSGTIQAGQVISGAGVTGGTVVVSQTSGTTGGAGVYVISPTQTVSVGVTMTGIFPNWIPLNNIGIGQVTGLTNANVTLSATTAAKNIINITGALTGNVVVYFPTWVGEWLVVNNTTGTFSVTAQTLYGAGVQIVQGTSKILWGDGTNLYSALDAEIASQTIGRNVVVNGGCEVSQVNGTTLITPVNGSYPIDNYDYVLSQASKLQAQQVNNVLNSLGAVTALTTSVLASYTPISTDFMEIQIPVEGYNFARFQYGTANAKAGSLQFKARASVAGTYSGAINNYAGTRSYPFSFVLAANTDTLITIPNIAGDTGGSWTGATNAGAAYIKFNLGSGSNYLSTAGTWQTGAYFGVTGTTNIVSQVNGSTLSITDVQFEVGSFCTTFERKLYDQVLRECQRYLPALNTAAGATSYMASGISTTATQAYFTYKLPITSRIPVTGLTTSAIAGFGTSDTVTTTTLATLSVLDANQEYVMLGATVASGLTVYRPLFLQMTSASAQQIIFTGAQI